MSNVADAASAGAKALKVSCQLNLSLCLLKTGQPEAAAAEASAVIAQDKQSLKGYFRRGQARLGAGQHAAAVRDLRKAASLAPGDATVEASLREAEAAAEAAGVATGRLDDEEEEEEEAPVPAPPAAAQQTLWNGAALGTAAGAGPAGFPGPGFPAGFPSLGGGAVDPRQLDAVREMLRSDPTAMQRMAESVGNLSPEQLEAMSAAMPAGMPKITPQIAEQMQGMMKNMSPEVRRDK